MNSLSYVAPLLVAIVSSGFTSTTLANQCGEISTNLTSLGDQYYELDDLSKSVLQNSTLTDNSVIDELSSSKFKYGEGTRTICFGASELRADTSEFSLKDIAPVRINSLNEMVIQALEHDKDHNVIRKSTVFLPLSDVFASTTQTGSLSINRRFRNTLSPTIRASLRETAIEVTHNDGDLKIIQSLYVNGYLAEWSTWNLR